MSKPQKIEEKAVRQADRKKDSGALSKAAFNDFFGEDDDIADVTSLLSLNTPEGASAKMFEKLFGESAEIAGQPEQYPVGLSNPESQLVSVDFPAWMVAALDKEAVRRGLTCESLIKTVICDFLDRVGQR